MSKWHFAFSSRSAKLFGLARVNADNAFVELNGKTLTVQYGFLKFETLRSNIAEAKITGPYKWFKVMGPHLSAKDDGLTLGTSSEKGVCISFRENIPSPLPIGRKSHSAVTVTISNCESFVEAANRGSDRQADLS